MTRLNVSKFVRAYKINRDKEHEISNVFPDRILWNEIVNSQTVCLNGCDVGVIIQRKWNLAQAAQLVRNVAEIRQHIVHREQIIKHEFEINQESI